MLSLFGRKKRKKYDVLVAYGEAMGVFDVWQMDRFARKLKIGRKVAVVGTRPAESVFKESAEKGVEVEVAEDFAGRALELKRQLEAENKQVLLKKLDEVADRSIMQDPC